MTKNDERNALVFALGWFGIAEPRAKTQRGRPLRAQIFVKRNFTMAKIEAAFSLPARKLLFCAPS
jgi:hypothetical protein